MTNEKLFIDKYKVLETILREQGQEYKDLETTSDRYTITRQMRNYITHHDDANFLEISKKQIQFLDNTIQELKTKEDILKKHMKSLKVATCNSTDRCTEALFKMQKLKWPFLYVLDTDTFVTIYDVSKGAIDSKTTKISAIKQNKNVKKYPYDLLYKNIEKNELIVVTEKDQPIGVLYKI